MNTHTFGSTREAYDACNVGKHFDTGEPVNIGDTIVIPSEQVVGIADAWPIAVTKRFGKLHTLAEGHKLTDRFTQEQVDAALEAAFKMEASHETRKQDG